MAKSAERLKRLVRLQEQIKALHETRHAAHLSRAVAARKETSELLEALNAASPLPGLFPDLYNRRIGMAIEREQREDRNAREEAARVATATMRTNMAERAYREAFRLEEREAAEKEQLENVERGLGEAKDPK
jgi:cation transport regulator ChaB